MEQPSAELSLATLNSKVKSRFHLYCLLSRKFKLPTFSSRAITSNYLKAYVMNPSPIFRILRTDFHPPFVVTRHVSASEVMKTIEKLLTQKKMPQLGLDEDKLPDFEWLIGVYFFLSPNDEYNLFPRTKKKESLVQVNLDPEYYFLFFLLSKLPLTFSFKIYSTISIAKFFEEEEPKKRGRNLFKLDEEQKQEMEEERILYRIKKQKNIQKYFEQKALAFDKKIQKLKKN